MSNQRTTLERAYDLAQSGDCANVSEIRERLKAEGRSDIAGQLYGPSIAKALRQLCVAAASKAEPKT